MSARPAGLDPTIAALIRERLGEQRFGVFFACGEGNHFPNGDEESSGQVVDEAGRHYTYWTAWNPALEREEFGWWYVVEPLPEDLGRWRESAEYRQACADAGWDVAP